MRARELRRASPEAEQAIWRRLRNRQLAGHKFRRQHPVGPYFADFACIEAQLIVELDGGQHFEAAAEAADKRRTAALEALGFAVLRFDSRQALAQTDALLTAIQQWLETHSPHPDPLPHAGEGANTPDPLAHAGEGANTPAPLAQAGQGANTTDPLPRAVEGANARKPT